MIKPNTVADLKKEKSNNPEILTSSPDVRVVAFLVRLNKVTNLWQRPLLLDLRPPYPRHLLIHPQYFKMG